VLTVYLTFVLGGGRWRTGGALAAALLTTSLRIVFWSRTASADPQNMLGIMLALLVLLEASERGRWWHLPLLGIVAAASCLMKGLPGVAVPAFVALLWALLVRGWSWLRPDRRRWAC